MTDITLAKARLLRPRSHARNYAPRWGGMAKPMRPVYNHLQGMAGLKSIAGIVKEGATPVAGDIVRLYDRSTGALLAETKSAADGSYLFRNINETRRYYVMTVDKNNVYNAVIADNLMPI